MCPFHLDCGAGCSGQAVSCVLNILLRPLSLQVVADKPFVVVSATNYRDSPPGELPEQLQLAALELRVWQVRWGGNRNPLSNDGHTSCCRWPLGGFSCSEMLYNSSRRPCRQPAALLATELLSGHARREAAGLQAVHAGQPAG